MSKTEMLNYPTHECLTLHLEYLRKLNNTYF